MSVDTWARWQGPGGLLKPSSWLLGHSMNGGWRFELSLPVGSLLPNFDRSIGFSATIDDGRGAIAAKADLVAMGPAVLTFGADGQGLELKISGVDRTTARLGKKGINFPTFRNTTVSAIASTLASAVGVNISNAPNLPIFEEDVKQANIGEVLKRYATLDAAQLLIANDGTATFTPYGWTASSWSFKPSGGSWDYDPTKRVTEITFVKSATMEQADRDLVFDSAGWKMQALPQPLSNIVPIDRSSMGAVVTIGFWEGDPSGGGSLISYWNMGVEEGAFLSVPQTGNWPATHITCSIMEPSPPFDALPIAARLKLLGSSPNSIPAGVDLAFEYTYSSGENPPQPADSVISEMGYPSLAHVMAKAPAILWDINKESNRVSCSGPLDCEGQVGDILQPIPIFDHNGDQVGETPDAQTWEVVHSWSGGEGTAPETSVTAYALPG